MIVTSVQIKTAKTQKHLYCLVFTDLCDYKAQKPKTLEKSRVFRCFRSKFQKIILRHKTL